MDKSISLFFPPTLSNCQIYFGNQCIIIPLSVLPSLGTCFRSPVKTIDLQCKIILEGSPSIATYCQISSYNSLLLFHRKKWSKSHRMGFDNIFCSVNPRDRVEEEIYGTEKSTTLILWKGSGVIFQIRLFRPPLPLLSIGKIFVALIRKRNFLVKREIFERFT